MVRHRDGGLANGLGHLVGALGQDVLEVAELAQPLLGLEGERGRLAAGYYADIVAMPGNPLDDILALRGIHFVMKEGRVFRHDETE